MNDVKTAHLSTASRFRRALIPGVAALLLLVILRPPHLHFKPDQAVYALVASEVLHGAVLYRDVWDNKGPALLFLYTGLYSVLGNRPVLYDLVQTGLVCLLALGAYLVARRLWGKVAGWGAAVMAAFACAFPAGRELNSEMVGAVSVVFGVHLLLLGLDSGRARVLVGAGALLAVGPLAKPVFLLDLAAVFLCLLVWTVMRKRRGESAARVGDSVTPLRAWGLAGVGCVLALIPFAAYFLAHGALADAWDVYVRSNLLYVQETDPAVARKEAVGALEGMVFALAALWGLAAGGVAGLWASRRPAHEKVLLCAWMAATVVGVMLGRRFFPHYLVQAFPPAAILAGWSLSLLHDALRARAGQVRNLAVAFALCLGFLVGTHLVVRLYNSGHAWMNVHRVDAYTVNEVHTAEYLLARTSPEDRIFVVGMNGHLSLLTGLRPASRFIYTRYLGESRGTDTEEWVWELWGADMERNRPRYVILSNYNRMLNSPEGKVTEVPEFRSWLEENYRHEITLRGPGYAHIYYNEVFRRVD